MVLNNKDNPEIYRYKQDAYVKVYLDDTYQMFVTLLNTDEQYIERHYINTDGRFIIEKPSYDPKVESAQGKITFKMNRFLKDMEPYVTYAKDPYFRGYF